jgi:K+-sensing histidine kinase KdpD
MNGFGMNNYSYSTIAFTIATPFYQRWWFRVLAFLAVAVIAYLIFRIRLRQYDIKERKLSALVEEKTKDLNLKNIQLEKNDEIKTRLISVINHDIITPLKFMNYAGNALVENKGNISKEEQLETISEITQTAKDMEMLSSQILNWIIYQNPDQRMQQEEFDLHQLVEMVFGVLRFSAKQKIHHCKMMSP